MPGMSGFELCTKLRALPAHKKTPVVFVTRPERLRQPHQLHHGRRQRLHRQPFLFIELTVKALIHVLRSKLQPAK